LKGKLSGCFATIVCELSGTDNTNGVKIIFLEVSPDIKNDRSIVGVAECQRIAFVLLGEDFNVPFFGELEFCGRVSVILPLGDQFSSFWTDSLDSLQGRVALP
jgi:hypothetical protein